MDLDYFCYELFPLKKLNRFATSGRKGVLLRYQGKFYADYAPWPQFGDLSVEDFLKTLKRTQDLPVFLQQQFRIDAEKTSLPHKKFFNHQLAFVGDDIKSPFVKLKFQNNLSAMTNYINQHPNVTFRLDFNNGLNVEELTSFWQGLVNPIQIDYIEDPFAWNESDRKQLSSLNLPLAADQNPFIPEVIDTFIFKPARKGVIPRAPKVIFSSYMGHDLGRYLCYLRLVETGDLNLYHGIDTPELFEKQKAIFIPSGDKLYPNHKLVQEMYHELKDYRWISL